jgi:hypothetical protein
MKARAEAPTRSPFIKDKSGLFHFKCEEESGRKEIQQAAKEAASHKPPGPAFFWAHGVFCPILPEDTGDTLFKRWDTWYSEFETDAPNFMIKFDQFTEAE